MNNKLVIIGNGFDLQAGLLSRFSDFFIKSEIPVVQKWLKTQDVNDITKVSFISLLLYNTFYRDNYIYRDINQRLHSCEFQKNFKSAFDIKNELVDWMDVEGFLNAVLTSENIEKLSRCFDETFNYQYDGEKNCICDCDCILDFFAKSKTPKRYITIDNFYEYFFEELKLFENRFTAYLKSEVDSNSDYFSKSSHIFNELIDSGDVGIVLNFNYTHITDRGSFKEINIHGSIDNNIIIGINDDGNLKSEIIQFTKTFRKLIDKSDVKVLSDKVEEVIIYGHSLGKQDYAYFQSIFDFLDLYNGSVAVRYIYSDNYISDDGFNPGHFKQIHRIKMAKKLFELMKEYGNTFNNKDNGQNLIHKMILEDRLKIEMQNFV